MKNIAVLGSTGSIGTQTLEIAQHDTDINIVALSANKNENLLEAQARKFMPELVCICDKTKYLSLKTRLADTAVKVVCGEENLSEVSCYKHADMVLTSVVGNVGLIPTINAIKSKKRILLANKETLVTGGEIIMPLAQECGVDIIPVDSEHCAVFQCLKGENRSDVSKILLTCSGGPFFGMNRQELAKVTVHDALRHPNWSMGAKITVDSATLMNKGLEMIEARWLFDVDMDYIEVYVHRQSIVHSMVEFCDNSVIAQLGVPDMKLPINYAMNYPDRGTSVCGKLDLFGVGTLTFERPDTDTFKCLKLAVRAYKEGGIMPAVMNGANEVAVAAFLNGKLGFLQIAEVVEETINNADNTSVSAENICNADTFARRFAANVIERN